MTNATVTQMLTDVNPAIRKTQAFLRYLQNRNINFQLSRRILCTSNEDAVEYLNRFGFGGVPEACYTISEIAAFFGVSDQYVRYLALCRTGLSGKTMPSKTSYVPTRHGHNVMYSPSAILALVPVATCGKSIPRLSLLKRIANDIQRGGYEALDGVPEDPAIRLLRHRQLPAPTKIERVNIANGITWSPDGGVSVSPQFAERMANDVKTALVNALMEAFGK